MWVAKGDWSRRRCSRTTARRLACLDDRLVQPVHKDEAGVCESVLRPVGHGDEVRHVDDPRLRVEAGDHAVADADVLVLEAVVGGEPIVPILGRLTPPTKAAQSQQRQNGWPAGSR